jgi:uncharacterized RDD family membrane protein YckC
MDNPMLELKGRNIIKTQWWIFSAFISGAIMTVLVMGIPLASKAGTQEYPENYDTVRWVCIGLSIIAILAKFWFQKARLYKITIYEKCQTLDEILRRHGKNFAISLGFCYAIFLFGLILFVLTYHIREWAPFMFIAGVLFATSTPSMKKLCMIVDSHTAEQPQVEEESFVGEPLEKVALKGVADLDRTLIPSLLIRSVAFIIDTVVVYSLASLLVSRLVAGRYILPEDIAISQGGLAFVLFIVYQGFSIRLTGRTVGCLLTGLRVISADGSDLTMHRSLGRGVLMLFLFFWPAKIPIFLLLHIVEMIITVRWGKNEFKQAGWDAVARTVVVRARARKPF